MIKKKIWQIKNKKNLPQYNGLHMWKSPQIVFNLLNGCYFYFYSMLFLFVLNEAWKIIDRTLQ